MNLAFSIPYPYYKPMTLYTNHKDELLQLYRYYVQGNTTTPSGVPLLQRINELEDLVRQEVQP